MINDIWQVIVNVTQEKLQFPLREIKGGGADDTIRTLGKEYGNERLLAMWLYYIGSSTERGYGISVEAFSEPRRLAKYAGMVTKTKKFEGKTVQLTGYICERDVSINFTAPWCMGEGALEMADEMPNCHPYPCPLCRGPMWWVKGSKVAELKEALREHFKEAGAMAEAVSGVQHTDGGGQRGDGDMRQLSEVAAGIAADATAAGVQKVVEQAKEGKGDITEAEEEYRF